MEQSYGQASAGSTGHQIYKIRRHAWKISIFVAATVIVTYAISNRLTPLYESTAIIDVDRQAPSAVIGQDSYRNYSSSSLDADEFLATQAKLIESDAVIRPVAQKYDLVRKERGLEGILPSKYLFRHVGTAPDREQTQNAPIALKQLRVTRPPNTFVLLIRYQSSDPKLASAVANGIAESYIRHTYETRMRASERLAAFMETQSAGLKAKMERSSQALARMQKELGVVSQDEKTNILAARLVQLNTDYTMAQSDRLKKEAIRKSLESGSLEALQVSGHAEQLVQLTQKLDDARQRLAEVAATYGSNHPEHRKIAAEITELAAQIKGARANIAQRVEADYEQALGRERMFNRALQETKAEADRINARFFEYAQLKQEADSDRKLYEELIWKIKESMTNAGFDNNNIRIADIARPAVTPVFPKKGLIMFLAFCFASVLGIAVACIWESLDNIIHEPEQINRMLETDVIGTLPVVRRPYRIKQPAMLRIGGSTTRNPEVANIVIEDGPFPLLNGYPEAIRMIRNTLELGSFGSQLRSLVITSASAGDGKTTTAVNLAIAHAKHGKKILLIDADLRNPKLHKMFDLPDSSGLSTILQDGLQWKKPGPPIATCRIERYSNLYVLPAGPVPDRPSDLIGSKFLGLLDELSKGYDLVIIDAPPLLGLAESMELAIVADGVLLVARAGKTRVSDLASSLSQLHRLRSNVIGVVLNRMARRSSGLSYYYSYDKAASGNRPRLLTAHKSELDSTGHTEIDNNGDSCADSLA